MSNEYLSIVDKIINNRKFLKLKNEVHHGKTNRYDHSLEVSYKSYMICKFFKLDYEMVARAALLHDFFFDSEFKKNKKKIKSHHKNSIINSNKITKLSEKEEDIISSHMYPFGGTKPKYIESIIVNAVDDMTAIKDNIFDLPNKFINNVSILLTFFITLIPLFSFLIHKVTSSLVNKLYISYGIKAISYLLTINLFIRRLF